MRTKTRCLSRIASFLIVLLTSVTPLFSQSNGEEILQRKFTYQCSQKTTASILIELSQLAEVSIGFGTEMLDGELRSYDFKEKKLTLILDEILTVHDQGFVFINNGILLNSKVPLPEFTISGFVEDQSTGEALIAATVYLRESGKGAVTNEFGFFSLQVLSGPVVLEISYIGYEKMLVPLSLDKNVTSRFPLSPSLSFEPIEVVASASNLQSSELPFSNRLQMSSKVLKSVPSLGGEPDLFRYLQQQPGITTGADGLGGMHVRGGNVDQNLIMLDGIPIFNPSHALGLFSVFNTSIVNAATLYRTGFSARFGGHLSSVLDVRSKEGNVKNVAASLDLSTMATKALVELPFGKEKGGFLLAMRRTHLDPVIRRLSSNSKFNNDLIGESSFYFYDINAKVNFKAGDNDRFYFSFYRGADAYQEFTIWDDEFILDDTTSQDYAQEDQYIDWSNTIGSFRWNHIYGDKLFSNVTATLSRFNYQNLNAYFSDLTVADSNEVYDYYNRFYSNILDLRLKVDFDYYLNANHKLIWGGEILKRTFEPGSVGGDSRLVINPGEDFDFSSFVSDTIFSSVFSTSEVSVYLEDQMKIGEYLSLNIGLRNSLFLGTDWLYNSLQPRLNIKYQPSKQFGIELGASKMSQFLHLVTAADAGLPNDLWIPSTEFVKPQHAWETSLAFGYQFSNGLKCSIAGYYKFLENVLAYEPDASLPTLMDNDPDFWEEEVEQGEGFAYGVESQFQYAFKNQHVNINYTWANSNRSFENLNDGFVFPSRYDRRHVFQLNYSNRISTQWEVQLGWTYRSGQPISLIKVPFDFSPLNTPNDSRPGLKPELVGTINEYQLVDYHRLDGNLKWTSKNTKHQVTFGAYNIYNRFNPIYVYQVASEISSENDGIRAQPGLGIIPTIGYHWKIK